LEEGPEIAVVGTKGQIVIPQQLRDELNIKPKTKLALYRRGNKIVVTKLEIPPLTENLEALFKTLDESTRGKEKPTEREILMEIQKYRANKQKKGA
jgi:AbrB family looped-hinge helix DNA binding protein